jgi:regulator of protease activity HflC (stomatin/prohibitin superfamily)
VAIAVLLSLKMANTWQKFVILRAGKLQGVRGPGLFWIIPVVDSVTAVVDERIQTTAFNAERALTKDLSITHKWRPVRAGLPGANRV